MHGGKQTTILRPVGLRAAADAPTISSCSPECNSSHEDTWMGPGSHITASGEPFTWVSPIMTAIRWTPDSSHWLGEVGEGGRGWARAGREWARAGR